MSKKVVLGVRYRLELYNPTKRKYQEVWSGWDYSRAVIMFSKPYNSRYTRRLIRVETDIAIQEKARKCGKT